METDRRQNERKVTNTPAEVRDKNGAVIASCLVCNISEGGAKLLFEAAVELPKEFSLYLILSRTLSLGRRCETIWRIGNKVGVRFPAAALPGVVANRRSGVWAAE